MAKVKMPKIEIRNKKGTKDLLTTGANTEILIDGKPLKNVHKLNLEIIAGGMAKLTVEMYGSIHTNMIGELTKKTIKIEDKEKEEKPEVLIYGVPLRTYMKMKQEDSLLGQLSFGWYGKKAISKGG